MQASGELDLDRDWSKTAATSTGKILISTILRGFGAFSSHLVPMVDIAEIVAELTGISIELILPQAIAEQSTKTTKTKDLTAGLLRDRIICLDGVLDSSLANTIVAQLLFLEAADSDRDIFMYINSLGGSVSAGMDIFETIDLIQPDVWTICVDLAAILCTSIAGVFAKTVRSRLTPNTPYDLTQVITV